MNGIFIFRFILKQYNTDIHNKTQIQHKTKHINYVSVLHLNQLRVDGVVEPSNKIMIVYFLLKRRR